MVKTLKEKLKPVRQQEQQIKDTHLGELKEERGLLAEWGHAAFLPAIRAQEPKAILYLKKKPAKITGDETVRLRLVYGGQANTEKEAKKRSAKRKAVSGYANAEFTERAEALFQKMLPREQFPHAEVDVRDAPGVFGD